MLASVVPTMVLSRRAKAQDLAQTRVWAVVVALFNVACLIVRGLEFPNLNTRWDQDAYGSITWALMALHTTHLVTDAVGTDELAIAERDQQCGAGHRIAHRSPRLCATALIRLGPRVASESHGRR